MTRVVTTPGPRTFGRRLLVGLLVSHVLGHPVTQPPGNKLEGSGVSS